MGLKFLPRAGHMVHFTAGNSAGQISRFVGRTLKPIAKGGAGAVAYVSDDEPTEVDPDSPDAAHLIRQARKGDPGVWPADEATAAACGVEFVKLARDPDGEWIAALKAVSAPQAPASVSRKPELKTES
jgi:hypothetical protein